MKAKFYKAVWYEEGFMNGIVRVLATNMTEARREIEATLTRDSRNHMRHASYQRWAETGKIVMVSLEPEFKEVEFVQDMHGNRFEKQGHKWFEVMVLPVGVSVGGGA